MDRCLLPFEKQYAAAVVILDMQVYISYVSTKALLQKFVSRKVLLLQHESQGRLKYDYVIEYIP